ncbi:MAG: hypothetical protein HYZ69_03960 [Candidatus Colwellbacteria bacterium]|nr:hypothetical protein [Candidatus Colwellbacteria bacterium]
MIKLALIFLGVIVADWFILPALFGFRDSFLSLIILILPVLYFGAEKRYILCGLFFSLVLEMFRGLNLGSLTLAFLFTAVLIYLFQTFLDVRHTYITRFNTGKLIVTSLLSVVFTNVFPVFYNWKVDLLYFRIIPSATIFVETVGLVILFNLLFDKKSYFNV